MGKTAQDLRELLKLDRPLLFAGVYDALSARIAQESGFDGVWISGYGVAASMLGKPDIGFITLTEMTERLRQISNAVDIPVVCDGEVGYGNSINVMRTVEDFVQAGAVGMQMGDAEYENCPYLGLPTKPLDEATALTKIQAVCATRDRLGADFMLFASQVNALDRAVLYAGSGADGLLFPWEPVLSDDADPQWKDDLKRVIDQGVAPVAVLAPFLPPAHRDELAEYGYKIIVLAVENLFASAYAQTDLWAHYMKKGTIAGYERMYKRQDEFLSLIDEAGMRSNIERFFAADYKPNTRARYASG